MTVVAYILMALGALLCLLNWGTLIASWRRKRFVSAVPFVGALPLGYGMSLVPETRAFAWLALIADYGTLAVILALPYIAWHAWSTSRVNLLHRFTSKAAGRSVTIKLFRRHVAVISVAFDPPVPCEDHGACIQAFGLVGTWAATKAGFSIEGYDANRHLLLSNEPGGFTAVESNYPSGKEYDYDSLGGLVLHERD